jgi:hypothetical protein
MAISAWGSLLIMGALRADDALTPVSFEAGGVGYIVSQDYAAQHKVEFIAGMPEIEHPKDVDFWTPTPDQVLVAERVFRDWIQDGAKSAAAVFPDMGANPDGYPPGEPAYEQKEFGLIIQNYGQYERQYVGLVVQGRKVILCSYFAGLEANPATDFVFMQKVFAEDKGIHFLQAWFDPDAKSCSDLVMVGMWQKDPPNF